MRLAVRSLVRNASFSAVVIVTLALGIGAATAMFTVVDSVLLRPLPYPGADRVVSLWTRFVPESGFDFPQFPLSGPELLDYREQSRGFEEVAGYMQTGALVEGGVDGESVRVQQVLGTANLFATLGVNPELGRAFVPGEDQPGAGCVVVLSHGLWREAFGGDPSVVGETTRIGGQPCNVPGVMPSGFVFPDAQARLWRNLIVDRPVDPAALGGRLNHNISGVGRLAPGVTLAQAEAETATLMAAWANEYPDHHTGHVVFLRPLLEDVVGNVRGELTMLIAAVGLVLVIICANVASVTLARAEGRRREVGVRLALGGSRGKLVVHELAESLVLAVAGGVLGLLLAVLFVDVLLSLYPGTLPRAEAVAIDWRAYAFAALTTAGSALLFGLTPALRSASTPPVVVLRSQGRGGHVSRTRLMRALVVAEVALSVTLVAGAGLLLRSYDNLRGVDLGFDANGVYTVSQALPQTSYRDGASVRMFYAALLERLRALPGVDSVGAVSNLSLTGGGVGARDDFIIEGRAEPAPGDPQPNAGYVQAAPGYLETLRIPLLAGRAIEAGDVRDAPWIAVINEATAQRYWPNESPLGQRLRYRTPNEQWITIVGVVGNTRVNGARGDPEPQVFVPHAQMPRDLYPGRFMTMVVRTSGDVAAVAPALHAAIRDADRGLPLIGGRSLVDMVGDSIGQPRFTSVLVTFFSVVALLLGALGIHGVLSYVVAQRVGEVGLRLALGAQPGAVLRLVIGQGMGLTLLGVVLGVGGALAAAQMFRGLLFGVAPIDAVSLGAAVAVLATVGFIACSGPARRAARVDPMVALREQ